MGVGTLSAAIHITPTVVKTLFKHYRHKTSKLTKGERREEATDDIFYDEAFNIVKSFIELGTLNTVESLQHFTNTHVPSPPWASVSSVLVPLSSCNDAADCLIDWFTDDELKRVVGGERWWQVRGLDGVEAEWVTEKKYLREDNLYQKGVDKALREKRTLSNNDLDILKMESLQKVFLYIHGGAYFWGSINTHRYQIIKYARKIEGKAFAVNYRKAPQFPWPCPLQDVLAAYLYLIRPPPSALHSPIDPSKIVLAGDSAGAGLSITLLTILRDLNLPLPAGAVLISPWVDLTHSFPSVMDNIHTDIIPPHGFIHKPSTVWPIDPETKHGRVRESQSSPPPRPGHADTLNPDEKRLKEAALEKQREEMPQEEMLDETTCLSEGIPAMIYALREAERAKSANQVDGESTKVSSTDMTSWEPKPPKVLMKDPSATPLELQSQIQLYATNEQLTHPLVSPILNGSLGNLCPLYIITGNHEALRDEIVYLAHRAAYPERFPPRLEAVRESKRQMENVERFRTPTKVHLQVFDDMCHVLTVFTFHNAVKYAYRSIAEFVKHVTENQGTQDEDSPFPELVIPDNLTTMADDAQDTSILAAPLGSSSERGKSITNLADEKRGSSLASPLKSLTPNLNLPFIQSKDELVEDSMYEKSKDDTREQIQENSAGSKVADAEAKSDFKTPKHSRDARTEDVFKNVIMLRQRVDIHGRVRPMEAIEDMPALLLKPEEIGLLREAPARRWQDGQQLWDKKFKRSAKAVQKKRRKNKEKYMKLLQRAKDLGLLHAGSQSSVNSQLTIGRDSDGRVGVIQQERRWGPLDLAGEDPPPSAIAARRDTPDALAILKKTVYHTAPRTVRRLPKRKTKDVVKAAFDPSDNPNVPPRQSASEQQHWAGMAPVHGMKIWTALMGYFSKKGSLEAKKRTRHAGTEMKNVGKRFRKRKVADI